jgi:hypothetical protein
MLVMMPILGAQRKTFDPTRGHRRDFEMQLTERDFEMQFTEIARSVIDLVTVAPGRRGVKGTTRPFSPAMIARAHKC